MRNTRSALISTTVDYRTICRKTWDFLYSGLLKKRWEMLQNIAGQKTSWWNLFGTTMPFACGFPIPGMDLTPRSGNQLQESDW